MARVVLAAVFMLVLTFAAQAERRVALVFGMDNYKTLRPLDNAVDDAQAIESALQALDFEVFLETNRDLRRMRRALDDFRADAAGADVALVFYAGHGVELSGENRLLPTDADASTLDALKASTLPLEEVGEAVAETGKIGLIVLDACRNDPFGAAGGVGRSAVALNSGIAAKVKPGLGRMGRAENILFAFSAAPGETAADGVGENSPFTAALVKYFGTDGLEIRSVLTLVQQEVYDLSRGKQLPYVESGLPKAFFAAATTENLPERERLLLAMAELTPPIRAEVEKIAAQHAMPLAPLYGALVSADLASLSNEDRVKKLTEAAEAYGETQGKLRTLSFADPDVARLRANAEERLAVGAFAEARKKLADAAALDARSGDALAANLVARRISEAQTHVADAGVARTQLDYEGAITALEKAAALHLQIEREEAPDEARKGRVRLLAELGDIHVLSGDTVAALEAYERMQRAVQLRLSRSTSRSDAERDLSVSHERIGDVKMAQGDLGGALAAYQAGHDIWIKLVAQDPANSKWQRGLSVDHIKIGDVRVTQGDLGGALAAYRAGLDIHTRLAAQDPANSQWQRDLSVSHERIGEVKRAQGDLGGALVAYQASLDIKKRLAAQNPANSEWQGDLSISHDKIGDVKRAQSEFGEALAAYQASLDIRNRLAAQDRANSQWQRDLSISHNNIGDVTMAQGDLGGALAAYRAGLDIATRLAAQDPANSKWQRDLSISHNKIGDVKVAQGDLGEALAAYQAGLDIATRLAAQDPANSKWRRDLSVSHNKIGDVKVAQGEFDEALAAYQASLDIRSRLAAQDPANSEWQRDLSISHNKIGDVELARGNPGEALAAHEAALTIMNRLATQDPANSVWQRDLIVSHHKMAQAGGDARLHLKRALEIALDMQARGVLAPADAWMPGDLRDKLSKLDAAAK